MPALNFRNLLRDPRCVVCAGHRFACRRADVSRLSVSALVEAIGAGGAILVFSVLFGLVHLLNPGANHWGLLNTVLIGVVLSVAYLRTRALWLPWGIHFAWNATLGLLFGLPVSGIRLFNVVVHDHGHRSQVAYRRHLRTGSQPARCQSSCSSGSSSCGALRFAG